MLSIPSRHQHTFPKRKKTFNLDQMDVIEMLINEVYITFDDLRKVINEIAERKSEDGSRFRQLTRRRIAGKLIVYGSRKTDGLFTYKQYI